MALLILSIFALLLALLPFAMFVSNRRFFEPAESSLDPLRAAQTTPVSVLIPARNEQESIRAALNSILKSEHTHIEVFVMDDHSEDSTREIVQAVAAHDARVQLLRSAPLPSDWNGKQHACWQLAHAAKFDRFLFLDADVRLSPDAITRCVAEQTRRGAPLVSGFPFQETMTWFEKMMIPMMHYVLLGYLPIDRMRKSIDVGFAAGCGQLFLAERHAYFDALGHFSIRDSRHDGIQLPRAFRRAGYATDIFDATDIARCRMYSNARAVWNGLSKNATEGVGNPRLIVPFSILLLGSSVAPILGLLHCLWHAEFGAAMWVFATAVVLGWLPRGLARVWFHQSWLGVAMHPLSVLIFVLIQWIALIRSKFGWKTAWRGRT